MKMDLPEHIAAYYSAQNRHDIDGMAAAFTEQAVVRDEGETHKGRPAIKAWIKDTTRRYRVTVAPAAMAPSGSWIVVDTLVTGNFPGSPATLTHRFELADDGIRALEIS